MEYEPRLEHRIDTPNQTAQSSENAETQKMFEQLYMAIGLCERGEPSAVAGCAKALEYLRRQADQNPQIAAEAGWLMKDLEQALKTAEARSIIEQHEEQHADPDLLDIFRLKEKAEIEEGFQEGTKTTVTAGGGSPIPKEPVDRRNKRRSVKNVSTQPGSYRAAATDAGRESRAVLYRRDLAKFGIYVLVFFSIAAAVNKWWASRPVRPARSLAASSPQQQILANPDLPRTETVNNSGSADGRRKVGGSAMQSRRDSPSVGEPQPTREPAATQASIRVVITPLRTQFGALYGAEARDEGSGALLSSAKQVAMKDDLLAVEETQYSLAGAVVYKGNLFFDAGNELVREEKIEGEKKWNIFQTWISDRP